MRVLLATIAARRSGPAAPLLADYLDRIRRYLPCDQRDFPSEARFLTFLETAAGRTSPHLVLTHPAGKQLTSEDFAAEVGRLRDSGQQQLVVAIGPPDGWSPEALRRAQLAISFGRITLPHELAAVVAAEQIYRAFTILNGHPYHSGH